MKAVKKSVCPAPVEDKGLGALLAQLRDVIREGRQQALRAVDVVQVRTCWAVGRHIVEFEQGGAARAEYGKNLLERVAARLTTEFGKGFDASNLYKMSLFYRLFPNLDALRPESSWTHYRTLLRVEDTKAREWYMVEAATQNWGTRALERQIGGNTVGIILCARKDETVVRYAVLHGNEQLFASKYKLVLPSEEELRAELVREQRLLAGEQGTKSGRRGILECGDMSPLSDTATRRGERKRGRVRALQRKGNAR